MAICCLWSSQFVKLVTVSINSSLHGQQASCCRFINTFSLAFCTVSKLGPFLLIFSLKWSSEVRVFNHLDLFYKRAHCLPITLFPNRFPYGTGRLLRQMNHTFTVYAIPLHGPVIEMHLEISVKVREIRDWTSPFIDPILWLITVGHLFLSNSKFSVFDQQSVSISTYPSCPLLAPNILKLFITILVLFCGFCEESFIIDRQKIIVPQNDVTHRESHNT